jgi:hypothetical protein
MAFCAPRFTSAALVSVAPGWDLFESRPSTTFAGQPFTGVPLGTFDFGGTIGVKEVGNADTIVHRQSLASVDPFPNAAPPIPIELVALQLVSVNPIDLGAGLGLYYVTLQSVRGGPASTGQMTITFDNPNGGTFDSFFDVFFDIRLNDLSGPIVLSDVLSLTSNDVPWNRTPDPLAVQILGVNRYLNGADAQEDFWPVTPFTEQHPQGAAHVVQTASIPEPSSLLLVGVGSLISLGWRLRRRRPESVAAARL